MPAEATVVSVLTKMMTADTNLLLLLLLRAMNGGVG